MREESSGNLQGNKRTGLSYKNTLGKQTAMRLNGKPIFVVSTKKKMNIRIRRRMF